MALRPARGASPPGRPHASSLPLLLAAAALAACLQQLTAFLAPAGGAPRLRAAAPQSARPLLASSGARSRAALAARGGGEGEEEEGDDDDYEFNPAEVIGKLKVGQQFEGVITKVLDFGAFVDIGSTKEGLVPRSKIQDEYLEESPKDVLTVGQGVTVWVSSTDDDRLTLSMTKNKIGAGGARGRPADLSLFEGIDSSEWLDGTVANVQGFGAFVSVKPPGGGELAAQGLVHITQVKDGFVDNMNDEVAVGDEVKVRILSVDTGSNRMSLTMKPEGGSEGGGGGGGRSNQGDVSALSDIPDTEWLPGTVKTLLNFGAIVQVQPPSGGAPVDGLVHISEIKEGFIEDPGEELEVDQEVKVRVLSVDNIAGKVSLSLKEVS